MWPSLQTITPPTTGPNAPNKQVTTQPDHLRDYTLVSASSPKIV